MDRLLHNSRKEKENFSKTDKKNSKHNIIVGTIIGVFIASTPLLFNLYESVPNTKIWNTFLFSYNSNYWEDAGYAMWVLTGKVIPLTLLLIWFFTNRHWWYHALLVPIFMYILQIAITISAESSSFDEFQTLYMLPVMCIVIPSIYLIRARMFNKVNNANKTVKELEEEFMAKPKGVIGHLKQYF